MHSLTDASDVVTRAGALSLAALFDSGIRRDRAVLGSILEAARNVDPKLFEALRLYLDDPIGVRGWPMSGPAFFGDNAPPVASPTAIARIREARVAAAYGLRKSASMYLEMYLRMRPERRRQIDTALEIYERSVLSTLEPKENAPAPAPMNEPAVIFTADEALSAEQTLAADLANHLNAEPTAATSQNSTVGSQPNGASKAAQKTAKRSNKSASPKAAKKAPKSAQDASKAKQAPKVDLKAKDATKLAPKAKVAPKAKATTKTTKTVKTTSVAR